MGSTSTARARAAGIAAERRCNARQRKAGMKARAVLVCLAFAIALPAAPLAQAQDYPNRLIKLMHGFPPGGNVDVVARLDRKSTRLNSSHLGISYAVFCLKKKNN